MTDKELKDLVFSLAIESKKTDEQMKKTSEEMKKVSQRISEEMKTLQQETQKEIKDLGLYIGNIARNQGDIAEEFFVNSISSTLKIGGIQYDELYKNLYKKTKKAEGEFDIVLVNGKQLLMIETKYKAHENDLDNLINKKYKNFKNLYPEYKDYTHNIGLASFYINDDIKEKALNENVIILQRKGDIIETTLP